MFAVVAGHLDYFFFGTGIELFSGGFIGVDLFFVISGFLITRNLLADVSRYGRLRLQRFYWHRFLRLFPVLALFLLLLVPESFFGHLSAPDVLLTAVLSLLFYVYNWFVFFTLENVPGTGHLWSLSVEEQFYLVWPVALLLLGTRYRLRWLVGCAAVVGVVGLLRWAGWEQGSSWLQLYLRTDLRLDTLMGGAALAFLGQAGASSHRVRKALLITIGFFLLAVFTLDNEAPYMYRGGYTLIGLLSTLLVFLTVAGGMGSGWWPLERLARISYGVYVYHMPIVMLCAGPVLGSWLPSETLRLGLAIVLTLTVAQLSYRVMERRFLALKSP